jgi:hypothetical protein
MLKWTVGLAVLAFLAVPQAAVAQDMEDGPPQTGIVTMSKMQVPIGPDRAKVMQWIERMVTPMERANPNVIAFYVLTHYYGADARDVVLVRVYKDLAAIEAPCGEPCQMLQDENPIPEEGTPEREELMDLWQTFRKYNANHSDEIFTARLDLAAN